MSSLQPTDHPVGGVDVLLSGVEAHLGALRPEETAAIYGAAVAQRYAPGAPGVSPAEVMALSQALGAFRSAPCRFCHLGLIDHALDVSAEGVEVRCLSDQQVRPLPEWLATPSAASRGSAVWAVLLWVGIPLVSLGLLAWAMPAVGAGMYRRRSWAVAAVAFLILAVVGFVITPLDPNEVDPVADAVLLITWLAGAGYGAFQIKPWLTARAASR
jgi:hypothetical protein